MALAEKVKSEMKFKMLGRFAANEDNMMRNTFFFGSVALGGLIIVYKAAQFGFKFVENRLGKPKLSKL